MKLSGNTVLITGSTSGIGLEIAKFFFRHDNKVIISGTDAKRVSSLCREYPGMQGFAADLSRSNERQTLFGWIKTHHPDTNILINNAGIQLRGALLEDTHAWEDHAKEIAINLEAPLHLCSLFIPFFSQKPSAIINVSSGLALTPVRFAPVYCATKVGVHNFTRILRKELAHTQTEVMEILPPAVDTQLGGAGVHSGAVNAEIFVDSVMQRLAAGENEVGYGTSEASLQASREMLDARFEELNAR